MLNNAFCFLGLHFVFLGLHFVFWGVPNGHEFHPSTQSPLTSFDVFRISFFLSLDALGSI